MAGGWERLTDAFRCQRSQRLGFPLPVFLGFPLPVETCGEVMEPLDPAWTALMSGLQRFSKDRGGLRLGIGDGCEKVSKEN